MNQQRRMLLQHGSLFSLMASAGLISLCQAQEWNQAAFSGKSVADVLRTLNTSLPENSEAIHFNAPDIAENGAVVPVGVSTNLKAEQIAILVEKNPNTLAAHFFLPEDTQSFVVTRIKMAETSNVYAFVKTPGKWLMAQKEIKVTLGGCGG